jgi:putative FmdB family regulatory protein
MPIYEYQCQACGHQLEEIQGFNDAPLVKCPECGKLKLAKLVSAPSFHLKGTGWYKTDFKNSGKKPAEVSEKSSSDDSGSGTATSGAAEKKVAAETKKAA